jgi:very-short-patch-repair endonuclease
VVSRSQLRALGLSDGQVTYATEVGFLTPLFRGTFAVGHTALGNLGPMQAAVLACGPRTLVSHGSAAALLGLSERPPALIHVISAGERGRGIDGIRWHRVPVPGPDEATSRHGIPCTTVSRTLVDLAGSVGAATLRSLVEEAGVQRSLDVRAIDRVLSRRRRRGGPRLRRLLAPWRVAGEELPSLRSRLEAKLWPRLVERGIPLPQTNRRLDLDWARLEVDFLWAERRLVVETDGAETHATAPAFNRDRWRDQLLVAAGYRVIRVTWAQLEDEPRAVVDRILRILSSSG